MSNCKKSILHSKWHQFYLSKRNIKVWNLAGNLSNKNVLWEPHLPLVHPVSWAALWLWACWRPSADTGRWARESRAPTLLSGVALGLSSALPLKGWHPPGQNLSVSWAARDTCSVRGVNTAVHPYPWGIHSMTPQGMPETVDSTEPYISCIISYTYIPMVKCNL